MVRVYQLADLLGKNSRETLQELAAVGVHATSANSRITFEDASKLLTDIKTSASKETARELIVRAFETARSSGKDEWQSMTVAVLKNRLLDLTEGGFRESEYGAPSLLYFAGMFDDLMALELEEGREPRVRIKDEALPALQKIKSFRIDPPEYVRLREDLWRAVFDFASGHQYVWDLDQGVARTGAVGPSTLALPTVTPHEESRWRTEFAASIAEQLNEEESSRVAEWSTKRLPTAALPPQLRGPWNGYVRDLVIERIRTFFRETGIEEPDDLLSKPGDVATRSERRSDTARLRALLNQCLSVMTHDELAAVPIPAGVLLRIRGADDAK